MRIGYAKHGRAMKFDPDGFGFQGDAEAPHLLNRLASRNPDVEWVIIGRNDAGHIFDGTNVTNLWADFDRKAEVAERKRMACPHGHVDKPGRGAPCEPTTFERGIIKEIESLDGVVIHAGQSGTSHMHIPKADRTWDQFIEDWREHATRPYDWAMTYGGYLLRGLNALGNRTNGRTPTSWIITDPRNYAKARDLKWPSGLNDILCQYQFTREQKHERFRDPRLPSEFDHFGDWNRPERDGELWISNHTYRYGGLELMMLPDDWHTWGSPNFENRLPVGVGTTSYKDVPANEMRRSEIVRDWILHPFPDAEVYGKWDKTSLADVPEGTVIQNKPHEFQSLLERWRVTVALPALGSTWTTAKPMQCFAARVVTFFIGRMDDQGWTLPSRRRGTGTHKVGELNGREFWSVRSDWTEQDLHLAAWLRVETAEELEKRTSIVVEQQPIWQWLVDAQRSLLQRRWDEHYLECQIEKQLGLRKE